MPYKGAEAPTRHLGSTLVVTGMPLLSFLHLLVLPVPFTKLFMFLLSPYSFLPNSLLVIYFPLQILWQLICVHVSLLLDSMPLC